jgi:hypothetical protein
MKAILTQTKAFKKKRSWSNINLDAMVDITKVWILVSVTIGTPKYFNIIKGRLNKVGAITSSNKPPNWDGVEISIRCHGQVIHSFLSLGATN